jgi:hypothetical protein
MATFGVPLLVPGALRRSTEDGPEIDPKGMTKHMRAKAAKAPPPTTPFQFDVRFPDSAARATHVYTKKPKKGLEPLMEGPYPIVEHMSKSIIKVDIGKDASGQDRHKLYHWANCQPAKLAKDAKNATAKRRGRPKKSTTTKQMKNTTRPPSEGGTETPSDTEDESEFDSSAEDEQEEEDEQPVQTTTKYGRASKPPQRLVYDK